MEFLHALEGLRTPLLDGVFSFITRLGEETVVIVVFCALYWCVNKRLAYIIGTGYFLSGLLVQTLKITFRVDRPWVLDPGFRPVQSALAHATGYSFPSGHTNSATALYGTLALQTDKRGRRAAFFILIALVAFSRMYLGVHTPLDVGVSFALTLLLCAASCALWRHYENAPRFDACVALAMLLAAAAVLVLSLGIYGGGLIELDYVADCFKAGGAALGFTAGFYIERRSIRFSTACDSFWKQPAKCLLGLAGLLALKEGLKPLLGASPAASALRYFIVILWATALFPLLIKRFFAPKANDDVAE